MGARETLAAFSRKEASDLEVMRSLAEHDDWYVPVHVLRGDFADRMVVYSEEYTVPEKACLVFTDREAADRGAERFGGAMLGAYAGGVSGLELLAALSDPSMEKADELLVNEGSDRAVTWYVGRDSFPHAQLWGRAVRVERAIEQRAPDLADLMRRFDAYTLAMTKVERGLVQVEAAGLGLCAVAFTAPDNQRAFMTALAPELQERVGVAALPGEQLFTLLKQVRPAGLVLNPNTTRTAVLDIGICELVLEARP